ncbi:hypothetical protein PRSY57_1111200 [Plasmodium reichenowi]|uniref:Uncharacterized protein n=1 Tax=Plasmodium reichenowi TaxID=5854 RepID=A0A151LC68_PLARE|nr:hypothetical protein PRSY57_1111200 [Plasmodium reichenowi]KYN96456.1 hypothetical protein PRSY57_1111200 [Plasmodium reichenowi]
MKIYDSFHKTINDHLHILNDRKVLDREKKMNSLNNIYDMISNFFNSSNNEEKENFCTFFLENLYDPLNILINDEFDECRIFVLKIYFLIEKNLNNLLLDNILFKKLKNEDNFVFICTSRLKEDENNKIIEEKEDIRLKIVQFLYTILSRHKNMYQQSSTIILNIFIYLEHILSALSILLKDPYPLLKKQTCQLLYELNIQKETKEEYNKIYKDLLTNLLGSLHVRKNDTREVIIKCLKIITCIKTNRNSLHTVIECFKKLCRTNISNNVIHEMINCIEMWILNIKDLNNVEKAKLIFIIFLCMNLKIVPCTIKRCYDVIENVCNDLYKQNTNNRDHLKNNEHILLYTFKNCGKSEKSNYEEEYNKLLNIEKIEDIYDIFFKNINYIFTFSLNKISNNVHNFFCEIKKELYYEIISYEKSCLFHSNEELFGIITLFLLLTHKNSFFFIKHILSFIYKSYISFKYLNYPSTPLLIDDLLFVLLENIKYQHEQNYSYQYESLLYLSKQVYVILICGYLMPIELCIIEIAKMIFDENDVERILTKFYLFNDENENYKEFSSNIIETKNHNIEEMNEKFVQEKKINNKHNNYNNNINNNNEYIFLNKNFQTYLQKCYNDLRKQANQPFIIEGACSDKEKKHEFYSNDHLLIHNKNNDIGNNTNIIINKIDERKLNSIFFQYRNVEDKNIRQTDEKNIKQTDEKNIRQTDEKNIKENDEKNIKQIDGKNIKQIDGKNIKENDEKNIKENDEKNIKENDEKNIKENDEKNIKENDGKNIKENDEKNIKENDEKNIKENDEKNIKENDEKNIKENDEKNIICYSLNEYDKNTSIIYQNKKILLIILSQILGGYYVKKYSQNNKKEHVFNEECINFLFYLIHENIIYENNDSYPYILITLKHVIHIIEKECKKYTNILFHFLIILQTNPNFCSHTQINNLMEEIEKYGETKKIYFYNYEYYNFIKNINSIINLNDFNNFKYHIDMLNILLCNISNDILNKYSKELMNFFYLIINKELNSLIKLEFLLFLNLFILRKKNVSTFFLKNGKDILKNILLPLCTWKAGLSEAQTRKSVLFCIRELFINNVLHVDIFKNNILIQNLICVLKSQIDDTWNHENREISIYICSYIVKYVTNNNIILDLLDYLIKLLDDSNISIRICTTTGIHSIFQNKNLVLSKEKCEYIFPLLLLHMDDDYEDVSKNIFSILKIAKGIDKDTFIKHAKNSSECSHHAKSYKNLLMNEV